MERTAGQRAARGRVGAVWWAKAHLRRAHHSAPNATNFSFEINAPSTVHGVVFADIHEEKD
jgi:hypothetical protein